MSDTVSSLSKNAVTALSASTSHAVTSVGHVIRNLIPASFNLIVNLGTLYVSLAIVAATTLVLAICFIVTFLAYPRIWVPKISHTTRGKIGKMLRFVNEKCEILERSKRSYDFLDLEICNKIRSASPDVVRLMNSYFRFSEFIPPNKGKLIDPISGELHVRQRWCDPDSRLELLRNYLIAQESDSTGYVKHMCQFAKDYDSFRLKVSQAASDDLDSLRNGACISEKNETGTAVALQELDVMLNSEHDRMLQVFSRRRGEVEGSGKDFFRVLMALSRAAFYEHIGSVVSIRWQSGIVDMLFPQNMDCFKSTFDNAFSPDMANKYWMNMLRIPLQKYLEKNKKKNVRPVNEYFFASKNDACEKRVSGIKDPFSSLSKGFNKVVKFILDFFWWLGFLLTNFRLVIELAMTFVVATIIWICLRLVTAPGINFITWRAYFYFVRIKSVLENFMYLIFTLALASFMCIAEFVLRFVSGNFAGIGMFQNNECSAPIIDGWHERIPNKAYDRFFGCRLPCRIDFSPDETGGMCVANESWQPGLCPAQQVYRLYNRLGKTGRISSMVDPAVSYKKYMHLGAAEATAMSLRDVSKTADFFRDCMMDPNLQKYRNVVRTMCDDQDALSKSPELTKACQAAHCADQTDAADATVCSRTKVIGKKYHSLASNIEEKTVLCDKQSSSSSEDSVEFERRLRAIVFVIALIVMSIFVSLATIHFLIIK